MEGKPGRARPRSSTTAGLYSATDLARYCQVDLKTIHNWVAKDEIPHFRTPGRHLRFRRVDVVEFLRRYGYAVPEILLRRRPRVALVDADENTHALVARTLGKRFELEAFRDAMHVLVHIDALQPEAMVIDLATATTEGVGFLRRFRAFEPTSHIRVIVFTENAEAHEEAIAAGAIAVVEKREPIKLRASLERCLGIE